MWSSKDFERMAGPFASIWPRFSSGEASSSGLLAPLLAGLVLVPFAMQLAERVVEGKDVR